MSQQTNDSPFRLTFEASIEPFDSDVTGLRTNASASHSSVWENSSDFYAECAPPPASFVEAQISVEETNSEEETLATLSEQLHRQLACANLLSRLTQALSRSLNPTQVLRTVVRELGTHLGVDRCTLLIHDRDASVIRNLAQFTLPGVPYLPEEYPAEGLAKIINNVREKGVLCFDDVACDERLTPDFVAFLRSIGARSAMYVSVAIADETIAALALSSVNSLRRWQASDVTLVRAVADQTGIALRQAQLFAQAETNARRERLINRLGDQIRASLNISEMLHTATHELGRAIEASRVFLRLFNPAQNEAHSAHAYIAPGVSSLNDSALNDFCINYDDPLGQYLLHDQRIIVVPDTATPDEHASEINALIRNQAAHSGARSEIICPVIVQDSFRGVLCIHQTDRLRRWTRDEVALVRTVATQLATGMAQAELFEMVTRAKKEWEATFDAMSDGIFIFDKDKRLVRVNRTGAALEDSYPHLLMGRRCCDILRAYGTDTDCVVERAIAEGRSTTLEVTPDRLQRPLLVTVEPIFDAGATSGAVCTVRDLSELHEVQTEARESQTLLMNILESAREGIFALDPTGCVQWCNSGTLVLSRMRNDEIINHNLTEHVLEEDRPRLRRAFRRAIAGESLSCEVGFITGDGELRFTLLDYTPLRFENRTTGVLGVARDITEQKQEREHAAQADKLRALGQLATGVAHDLNNSLAAILGRAQLLQRAMTNPAQRQHLDIINTAAEDAAATVNRIQTFARQSQAEDFELLDLRTLLQDAIEITRTRWENEARAANRPCQVQLVAASAGNSSDAENGSDAENDTDAENSAALNVHGVASELREVFVNLIINAIDAMPQGGTLTIKGERAGGRLRLHFADTGTGMHADVRTRIFEPFYTTKGAGGTGLGLFVSFGIIERHRGSITAH